MKKNNFNFLTTKYEKELSKKTVPFDEYPRPQLKRDSYFCLNGLWEFKIEDKKGIKFAGQILVPFAVESRLSKVFKAVNKSDRLIYEKTFILPNNFLKNRVLLHFGACDQYAKVYFNGKLVGENVGVLPFSFDVTEFLTAGENTIKVIAIDPLNTDIPYGKQRKKRGGMWYTTVSGIYKTVWMESVYDNYIKDIKIDTDLNSVKITVFGGEIEKTVRLLDKDYTFTGDSVCINIDNPNLWSPENPNLYEFTLFSGKDKVSSYFGLRTIKRAKVNGTPLILLNDKPYFFNGLLDQGYYSDGIYLPATVNGFIDDILRMKECGFNMLRKHIKFESDLFYYYCDKYGMIVFQDMINNGKYNFIIDTALPTVFLKRGITHYASKNRKSEFIKTAKGIIERLYNHPSVVYYTIFNEGWGQFSPKKNYALLKSLDSSRIFDTTSGWFKSNATDVESDHVYFKKIKKRKIKDKPWVLSEFGGYSYKINEHSFNKDKTYGYKYFTDKESFEKALISLYKEEIIPAIDYGLTATVLTQVSDVEDETNGLLTFDRKVLKVDAKKLKKLSVDINKRFNDKYS